MCQLKINNTVFETFADLSGGESFFVTHNQTIYEKRKVANFQTKH